MLDGDVAQTLGAILREELDVKSEILAIDGVVLWDFDYIDLGRIRLPSMTVPVTIKSLVFSEDPRLPRGQAQNAIMHDHDHSIITGMTTTPSTAMPRWGPPVSEPRCITPTSDALEARTCQAHRPRPSPPPAAPAP